MNSGWVPKAAARWHPAKIDAGYACYWPVEPVGVAAPRYQAAFNELVVELLIPTAANSSGSVGLIARTVGRFGTPTAVKHCFHIGRMDELACQLFSDPAAVRISRLTTEQQTAQVVDPSGQKVWTSGAHSGDWGAGNCPHDRNFPNIRAAASGSDASHWCDVRPIRR